jgi:hypothetical protein
LCFVTNWSKIELKINLDPALGFAQSKKRRREKVSPGAPLAIRGRLAQIINCSIESDEIMAEKSVCIHCGKNIKHFFEVLWHAEGELIFPQYCQKVIDGMLMSSNQLHEPKPKD